MTRIAAAMVATLALTLPGFVQHGLAQQIPPIDGTTLTGVHVALPSPANTKPLLIVVAFSHKGGDDAGAWNKRFQPLYAEQARVDYVELADFQGVPSFIMTMILHGMRRSVQEPERSHLAPFFSQQDAWKKLIGFSSANIAYALLADPAGHVVWHATGPATDAKAAEMLAALARMSGPGHP